MLKIKNVTKRYSENIAVDNMNFEIESGDFFGLLGPNGAGKTTLMRIISSVLIPDSGKIFIDGEIINRNAVNAKRKLGIVPQYNNLEMEMTARQNLELQCRLYGVKGKNRKVQIDKILELIELQDRADEKVKNFSGGMLRKLMIGRALIHEPLALILDEPTTGLDPISRRKMWDFMRKLPDSGLCILLTTHYIEEAQSLCNKIGLIDKGRLLKIDTPESLINMTGKVTIEYYEAGRTKFMFFATHKDALEMTVKIEGKYKIRDTTLEDVFVAFNERKVN